MSTVTLGPVKSSNIPNGEDASDEIDLGQAYQDVQLSVAAAEAAQLAVGSVVYLLAATESGGTFNPVYNEAGSAVVEIDKPAAGGILFTFQNVNARYIMVMSDDDTDAQVDFTVRGVGELESIYPLTQRKTIAGA